MGEIKYFNPASSAKPSGPYHTASKVGGRLSLAGQIPVNPNNSEAPIPEGFKAQAELVFENISLILKELGYSFTDIVQVGNFLIDLENDMECFNKVYSKYVKPECLPPRTTIGVSKLAKGCLIEIYIVAYNK